MIARLFLLAMFVAPSAVAQDAPVATIDDLFVIEGKIQRPEVVVVIRRENLDKEFELELRESFLRKIVDALSQPPF